MSHPYEGRVGMTLDVRLDADNPGGVMIVIEDFGTLKGLSFCVTPADARELAEKLCETANKIRPVS